MKPRFLKRTRTDIRFVWIAMVSGAFFTRRTRYRDGWHIRSKGILRSAARPSESANNAALTGGNWISESRHSLNSPTAFNLIP
jgi:hypothetical protein